MFMLTASPGPETPTGIRDTWATPKPMFREFHREWNFTRDICANAMNHKLPDFVTEKENGLDPEKWKGQRIWCNPPFSNIRPWVTIGRDLARSGECPLSVFMLPVMAGVRWYDIAATSGEFHQFLGGRTNYEQPSGINRSSPTFGSMLAVFTPEGVALDIPERCAIIFRTSEGVRITEEKKGRLL